MTTADGDFSSLFFSAGTIKDFSFVGAGSAAYPALPIAGFESLAGRGPDFRSAEHPDRGPKQQRRTPFRYGDLQLVFGGLRSDGRYVRFLRSEWWRHRCEPFVQRGERNEPLTSARARFPPVAGEWWLHGIGTRLPTSPFGFPTCSAVEGCSVTSGRLGHESGSVTQPWMKSDATSDMTNMPAPSHLTPRFRAKRNGQAAHGQDERLHSARGECSAHIRPVSPTLQSSCHDGPGTDCKARHKTTRGISFARPPRPGACSSRL